MSSKIISSFGLAVIGISFLVGCGAVFVNDGSKNASMRVGLVNPASSKPKVNVPAEAKMITNFDDGSKNMNSKLYGASSGSWIDYSYAGNTISPDFVVSGGANGTKMAAHIFGTLIDKGDKSYPAFTLEGKFKDSGYYDASQFDGIRFYYKCPSDDSCIKRRFSITIAATVPTTAGGTCQNDCYNHFGLDMAPSDVWVQRVLPFAEAKRLAGWGSPVTPPDLIDHLTEFMSIKWDHSADNNPGKYNVDFWADEIEFF
jgi:hypothetical protein